MLRFALFPGCNISLPLASIWPSCCPENLQFGRPNAPIEAMRDTLGSARFQGEDIKTVPSDEASAARRDRLGRGMARSNAVSGRSDFVRQHASIRYRGDAISSGGCAGPLAVSSRPGRRRHPASSSSRLPFGSSRVPQGIPRRASHRKGRLGAATPHTFLPTRRQVGPFRWQGASIERHSNKKSATVPVNPT